MGGISPRPRGQKQSPRCVIFASSLQQTAGRPGWMPPAPAGPAGQRCSVTKPRPWPGGSTPPTGSSVGGGPGSQGVSPSSFWPTREPVSGGRWPPHTSRCPGPWKGVSPTTTMGPGSTQVSHPSLPRKGVQWRPGQPLHGPCQPTLHPEAPPATLEQLPRCPRARPKPLRPS